MKYKLHCTKCGKEVESFKEWFRYDQSCPVCGGKRAELTYSADYNKLGKLFLQKDVDSFWTYFDFLPLEDKSDIISFKEGAIPIEEWAFMEDYAKKEHGVSCKVYVYRNDLNGGTGSFKDVAASLAASVFKEEGVKEFCAASTGNTATAYSKYLAAAGVKFNIFVPETINPESYEEMLSYGQNAVKADGDYACAKKLAADYHTAHNVMISAGNIDPLRVEAKRTMVFEFMRQLGKMPDVYLQAVSGGTGPIALDKGVRELSAYYPEVTLPRMLMVQQDLCDPMVLGWEEAERKGFPEGYEKEYPSLAHIDTKVSILSTGTPATFPILAPIVKKSGGRFLRIKESELVAYAKKIKGETGLYFGPASIVCFAGFYEALQKGCIKQNDLVLVNLGETADRAREFVKLVKK